MDNTKEKLIFQSGTGNAEITIHKVFPGIELCYNDVHMDRFTLECEKKSRPSTLIEINHCKEGRMEQQIGDEFFYLMPGDLSITLRQEQTQDYSFPLRHYHGIKIVIDSDVAPECFSCFLQDVNVQPMQVARHLCGNGKIFVLRSEKYIEHIFSELYSVPKSYEKGYLKIKILELLLVLSGVNPGENGIQSVSLSQNGVHLAKDVAEYLRERMGEKVSITELSNEFHISKTHLQNIFKSVYGMPIYSYSKIQKIQAAALELIHTSKTVTEIALDVGYSNASKFSEAFSAVMGEAPMEYRKLHTL